MKKIYHLAENVSNESGGLRTVVVNLDKYLNKNEDFSSLVITNYMEPTDNFFEFKPKKIKNWNYSSELENFAFQKADDFDIAHLHGVFMHTQYVGLKLHERKQKPFVITPHGMLEPWHLKDKALKKNIYRYLILNKILNKSSVLHAITPLEKDNLYRLTNHKQIIEIPNLIYFNEIPKIDYINKEYEYILFLSRIHPKKGLDILIKAMSKINNKSIKLKIVGTENQYSIELKKQCKELNIENRIEFLGSVYGLEKYKLYSNAKAFILPSYSEAIGMVNLEAASCQTPVLTTYKTGINSDWGKNGGIMINPNLDELINSLNLIASWNNNEREQRGKMLSEYVLKEYSWEKKGHLWDDLYNSI